MIQIHMYSFSVLRREIKNQLDTREKNVIS